jgi:lipopolysaccharide transport system permease protein
MIADRAQEAADPELIDRAAALDSFGATVTGLVRYRELIKNLVVKDLKLKYRGSVFGFLWSLANPLLMMALYTVVFTYIIRQPTEGFVFLLLLGILAWTFFANSAMMSTGSIAENGGLLKSVFFPRAILPIATVLFNFVQYALTILVLLPIMLIIFGIAPAAPMLLYPIFLALQVIFTTGIALMLATGTVFFRGIRHLLEIALAILFWTTPIVYELTRVPEALRLPLLLSPLSPFVVAYKQMFFYRQWPDLSVWVVATVYAFAAFAIGFALLLAHEDRFAEQL